MYNNSILGVGIVTCNRKDSFKRLFDEVIANPIIDYIIIVKNKEFDYAENDPIALCTDKSGRTEAVLVKDDLGVGYCKNMCLKKLIERRCQHFFLIEDDINIKNNDVFKYYIDTAKAYNLQHMNFCMAWDSITKKYLKPAYSLCNKSGVKLSIFNRLCGDFEYFTYDALQQVGLFDAKHYINAFEHAEHTYRISLAEMTTPFYAFADVYNSSEYIEDTGIESSIHYDAQSQEIYKRRVYDAGKFFAFTYGKMLNLVPRPSPNEVHAFLERKVKEANV